MAYRDDRDALQSRVEELEGELATATETIAQLRGEDVPQVASDDLDRFTGVRKHLHLEREMPVEVNDTGLVAIADLVSKRIPGGSVSQVGDTLTHRKASYSMRLTRGAGRTSIQLDGDYRSARTQLAFGSPGITLLGATLWGGIVAGISGGQSVLTALGAVFGAVAGFIFLRWLVKRATDKDRRNLVGAFESVASVVATHARASNKTRIEATTMQRNLLAEEQTRDDAASAESSEDERAARREHTH